MLVEFSAQIKENWAFWLVAFHTAPDRHAANMLTAHHDSQWCVVYKPEIRFEIAAILMAVDCIYCQKRAFVSEIMCSYTNIRPVKVC